MSFIRSIRIWTLALIVVAAATSVGLAQDAGITPQQREQLRDLGQRTKIKAEEQRNQLRRAKLDLAHVYSAYNLNERKVKTDASRIGAAQIKLLNIHMESQIALRQILSETQFQILTKRVEHRRGSMRFSPFHQDRIWDHFPDRGILDGARLTPEQHRKLEVLIGPKGDKGKLIQKLKSDSDQIMELYSNYNLDVPAARKLIESIHDGQSALANVNNRRQRALRSVLSEAQFIQIQGEMAKQVREKRQPKGRHGD